MGLKTWVEFSLPPAAPAAEDLIWLRSSAPWSIQESRLRSSRTGHANFFLATRQCNKKIRHMLRSRCVHKWSCRNEYRHLAITKNVVEGKHGHIVAAVFSQAQLWVVEIYKNLPGLPSQFKFLQYQSPNTRELKKIIKWPDKQRRYLALPSITYLLFA